ncbi:TPA: type IV toxin-antitoxin system AbiEi family antitoxin domain-containing protein [Streptococcus agalactiae]|uniref:type IV toxin-antitoxin system AbiEi family antitoxin domain-containing protein n=1 Tax=Streptococcus anginosus TaxID=1328 RepID=UPI000B6F11BD|nr:MULTISPECIES: type IV toxin-antitoxin system AbiEi family antitoxin domain-containing protein [Streptococcus]HEL2422598.1 type IV toxin-antitoxin system AbiEi family antitoxin domain-containing protein [Streptococcus suis]KAA9262708.1 abortive phage infection protein [Streptococcus anginosus]OTG52707.1 abortive phage infection protein [Streptococcus agalactiae]PLA72377.1 abortive phage infection protein [Streptococcus anginosus]WEB74089.1 type IV toxin-antitoxin system AbiEi family antitoxi
MSNKETVLNYLKQNNGIITYKDCKELGVPAVYLSRLENEEKIFRVDKGIYLSTDGDYDEYYFFQYRFSRAIYSYVSALYLQGFTDEIPQYFEVTVPRGYRFNNPPQNLAVHTVPKEIVDLGVISVKTPWGQTVKTYDFERIICDFIQNRKKIDNELFAKTLKAYVNYPNKNLTNLYQYAEKMKIINQTKQTLEVLM